MFIFIIYPMNRQKIIALFAVSSLLSLHAYADSPASSLTSEDRTKAEVTVSADLYIEGNDDATTAALEVEGDALIQGDQYIRGTLILDPAEGAAITSVTGAIRYNTTAADFQGYDGSVWRSLTVGSSSGSFLSNATIRGKRNIASGTHSTAWGNQNKTLGSVSTAWGTRNLVSGYTATAWGNQNTASRMYSTAWGNQNKALGNLSTAWGFNNAAESFASTAFGRFNIGGYTVIDAKASNANGDVKWFPADPLLEVGVGANDAKRANVLTLLKNGRIAFGKHNTLEALQTREETVQIKGALLLGDYPKSPDEPTPGAIRYNRTDADFEGFNGTEWKSLTTIARVEPRGDLSMGPFTAN